MKTLPPPFSNRIQAVFGDQGRSWLEEFPALRADFRQRWMLQDPQPIPSLSYNYLETALTASGQPVVLKLGVPNRELDNEIRALQFYAGGSAARLLEADPKRGALLLERIIPGTDLGALETDQQAARIAGQLMTRLWKPAPPGIDLPSAGDWCRGFERYRERYQVADGPLPVRMVADAGSLAAELLADGRQDLLLHGDLHHGNILLREDQSWAAIDPKGVLGEPSFEVGPFLYNPIPEFLARPHPERLLESRLADLVETTGLDRKRMAAWSFCRAVLSAVWSLEDNQPSPSYAVRFARLLQSFL